ncbi:glycosyltransferase family 2 protein [Gordonia spumicola]|nr:glycosyltransferase [Gordonia spumicola]
MNSERTLRATIDSVLAQDFVDYEIVVSDNASDDSTIEIAESFGDDRIRIERHTERVCLADNWHRGVLAAHGDLVKLLCSDDLIAPTCLSVQTPLMTDPEVALVASRYDVVDDDDEVLARDLGLAGFDGRHEPCDAMRAFVRGTPDVLFPTAAVLFRRDDYVQTRGFRDEFVYTLDFAAWLDITARGALIVCPEPLAGSRASAFNVSSSTSTWRKARDVMGFNRWAYRVHGGAAGPIRRRDEVSGDLVVLQSLVHRLYLRATGTR